MKQHLPVAVTESAGFKVNIVSIHACAVKSTVVAAR